MHVLLYDQVCIFCMVLRALDAIGFWNQELLYFFRAEKLKITGLRHFGKGSNGSVVLENNRDMKNLLGKKIQRRRKEEEATGRDTDEEEDLKFVGEEIQRRRKEEEATGRKMKKKTYSSKYVN
nr:uncharacterized protein LOC117277153 [Nicotiana tomentosiformis]